ncbi:MAG: RNA polymerase sigma factor [Comamonas sp.]|jgi:RNA polymerase sigma-70 factor (ECF subfamily)|uniref:RNA polymerase sigma factor n=1 Tax=Comamonas sp. TaxID=34028 RepID=UPI0028392CBB|nr:RNA polymerase sigma factor [Comamonas sp.]MDR0215850.1 RNA polymerase sigma factor [Comamonas sp.]
MNARVPNGSVAPDEESTPRGALARTYMRLRAPLQRLLGRSMRRREDAEDGVQEVFLRYAAAGKQLPEDQEAAYLHTAARNVSHTAWKQDARRESVEAVSLDEHAQIVEELPADEATEPFHRVERCQRLSRIEAAIAELPERRREAFVLHAIDGLHQTEVAERMGITRRMVHNHVTLAYAYCQIRVQYRTCEEMKIAQALQADEAP